MRVNGEMIVGKEIIHCFRGQKHLRGVWIIELPYEHMEHWAAVQKRRRAYLNAPAHRFGLSNVEVRAYLPAGDFFKYYGSIIRGQGTGVDEIRFIGCPASSGIRVQRRHNFRPYDDVLGVARFVEQRLPEIALFPADAQVELLRQVEDSENEALEAYTAELVQMIEWEYEPRPEAEQPTD